MSSLVGRSLFRPIVTTATKGAGAVVVPKVKTPSQTSSQGVSTTSSPPPPPPSPPRFRPLQQSTQLVTQHYGSGSGSPPTGRLSKMLHSIFGISSVPQRGSVRSFEPMPKQLSELSILKPKDRLPILARQAAGLWEQSSSEISQVVTRIESDDSHRYAHIGRKQKISSEAVDVLKQLAQDQDKKTAVQMLLESFPSLTTPRILADSPSGDMDVRLSPGAHIRASIDIIDLGQGKLSFSLLAHTQSMHPLRGMAAWNLIVDTEKQEAAFCVTGTGHHNSKEMDQANNQLIECGFWEALGESLMDKLNGKTERTGRHQMFSLLQAPNMLMGPLMSMTSPVDSTQVAESVKLKEEP